MTSKTPYFIAFGFAVCSFILCLISCGTGYWFTSKDPDNLFQSIGLWQACFNGYEHTSDLIGKAYEGCWWIFYKEYYYIRNWLMPPWFKAVQTLSVFGVVFQFISLGLLPLAAREANNIRLLVGACFTVWMMAACQTIVVVVFGVMIGEDRTWMPRYDLDRLDWSYGLAVLCGFFAHFSGIALTVYTLMRKYDIVTKRDAVPEKRMPRI
jgi:hypothetical protein